MDCAADAMLNSSFNTENSTYADMGFSVLKLQRDNLVFHDLPKHTQIEL